MTQATEPAVLSKSTYTQELRIGPFRLTQVLAGILLIVFIAQCAWFISHVPLTQVEANYVASGTSSQHGMFIEPDAYRSPLVARLSAALVPTYHPAPNDPTAAAGELVWIDQHRWFVRLPFLFCGLALGASLWFVARRLFGTQAGFIALGLYCFSPGIIARSSLAGPEIVGAWGAFGVIFTAIATAHTLYAPREVVVWNWKRILILGISMALAIGAQWSLWIVLVPALAFMLWAVPHRKGAALAIFGSAAFIAVVLLDVIYTAHLGEMWVGFRTGHWAELSLQAARNPQILRVIGSFFLNAAPATLLIALLCFGTYAGWPRARFFGNTAPLLVFALLFIAGFIFGHAGAATMFFYSLTFLMLFVAGVCADLFESPKASFPIGIAYGAIVAQVIYSVAGLYRIFSQGA